MIGGGNRITSDKFLLKSLVGLLVRVNATALTQFILSLSFTTLPVLQLFSQNYSFPKSSIKTFNILLQLYLIIKRRPQFPLKRKERISGPKGCP